MEIRAVAAGGLAVLEWNGETVRVIEQSDSRTTIQSLSGGGKREVSPATPVAFCAEPPISATVTPMADKSADGRIRGEVTHQEFRNLMAKRKRTADDLVDLFRGKIEDPREFFERVMSWRYHGEDRSGVVIPYRSVIEFYQRELGYWKATEAEEAAQANKRKRDLSPEQRSQIAPADGKAQRGT